MTEKHLAQILTVYPNSYKFHYEKMRSFGTSGEKYELIATPILDDVKDEDKKKYNNTPFHPLIALHRRRVFFDNLMSLTKDHHEAFLYSLDPPLVIPKEKLTRWHAEFDPESCPDIKEAPLPLPPNSEKFSSAKDVLNKARDLFNANPRMEKALLKLSENQSGHISTPASASIPALANALKGIPKSLLEKVRAKQAAKTLELLTRPPELSSAIVEQKRLPEIARIIRNVFVGEKKNVLKTGFVVEKVRNSYREYLNNDKILHHISLIIQHVPGWLTSLEVDYVKYLRLNKTMDMGSILSKLESLTSNVDV